MQDLNQIDFNRLRVFYQIYDNKNMIAAAENLRVTPSAVSQHLKKLEEELKVNLFTRMHKKLVPTAEATFLFGILEPFFSDLEAGLNVFRDGKKDPAGLLRIGAPVEFGKIYFPDLIAKFRQKYPQVRFSMVLGNAEKSLSMLKTGELDFALVDLFLDQRLRAGELSIYAVEALVDEEVILACSKSYFEENIQDNLSFENLLRQEFISYDYNNIALRGWFRHHFGKQCTTINTVLTVDSMQMVVSAIYKNIGLGVITCNSIQNSDKNIIAITPTPKKIVNKISLIQLQDKVPTLAEKRFQSYLKSTYSPQLSTSNNRTE